MIYNILATGSSGNAVIINDNILVDCGVPFKTIEPYAGKIKIVLLTHYHSDHFKKSTVAALHSEHPAIRWCCCEWMVSRLVQANISRRSIDIVWPVTTWDMTVAWEYKGVAVICPVEIPHDVPNCAWEIVLNMGDRDNCYTIFYATDTSTLGNVEAVGRDLYMIEANYKKADMERIIQVKRSNGEYAYEINAMRNHLSEEQALDWLAKNMRQNSQYVFLHQHVNKKKE